MTLTDSKAAPVIPVASPTGGSRCTSSLTRDLKGRSIMSQHSDTGQCRYCTVPTEVGDVCTFCRNYTPPAESDTGNFPDAGKARDRDRADCIASLKSASKHTLYAAEDIGDVLESLPDDAPLFACVDLVAAVRHIGKASALLASAAQAVTQ